MIYRFGGFGKYRRITREIERIEDGEGDSYILFEEWEYEGNGADYSGVDE